jgi:hypothetical protein
MQGQCSVCGSELGAEDRFCGECGASLAETASKSTRIERGKIENNSSIFVSHFSIAFVASILSTYIGIYVLELYYDTNYFYQYILNGIMFIVILYLFAVFINNDKKDFLHIVIFSITFTFISFLLSTLIIYTIGVDAISFFMQSKWMPAMYGEIISYIIWCFIVALCYAPLALIISRLTVRRGSQMAG